MNCPKCGTPLVNGAQFCPNCGSVVSQPQPQPMPMPQPMTSQITVDQLPEDLKPLSPWAYFGYTILFAIPLVGFICLLVFSFGSGNVNRKNFARSYLIVYVLAIIITIILTLLGVLGAATMGSYY